MSRRDMTAMSPTHPERIDLATETLAALVKQMAERRDAPGNYVGEGFSAHYKVDLVDMSNENLLSFPVYLLLRYTWNDILDWSDDPNHYVGERKPVHEAREFDR